MFLRVQAASFPSIRRLVCTHSRTMGSGAPVFKPFTLALIQLGNIGSDKAANLAHARDMIRRAAAGNASVGKPDLIVLPVSTSLE